MSEPDEIITILCRRGQNRRRPIVNASITVAGADYAVKFGYDQNLIKKFKDTIPESERKWHRARAVWLVHPDEIDKAIEVIKAHTDQAIEIPAEKPSTPEVIEKSFLLEYLGATKDRGKRVSAYGSVKGEWSVEMPEDVLKNFFERREVGQKPDGLQTLYQVLCVVESIEPDKIKSAYRRLARQWHPDVCQEENATEMFQKINEAYLVLIDPEKRQRYDAGLYFERQNDKQQNRYNARVDYHRNKFGYRAPLRCGQVTARGTVRLMRFTVSEILNWDDVIDHQGRVMVTSWPKGSDHFVTEWLSGQSPF